MAAKTTSKRIIVLLIFLFTSIVFYTNSSFSQSCSTEGASCPDTCSNKIKCTGLVCRFSPTAGGLRCTGGTCTSVPCCSNADCGPQEVCFNNFCSCIPFCFENAGCDDGNPNTIDRCQNPGTCNSFCTNTPSCGNEGASCTSNTNCCSDLVCDTITRRCKTSEQTPPRCGDGNRDPGEACDNGANNGACPKTCSTQCTNNNCQQPPPGNNPPTCSITSPPAGSRQTANFPVRILYNDPTSDNNQLSTCRYRVFSSNQPTKLWTSAGNCGAIDNQFLTPTVTVGTGQDCRNNGPDTCRVECIATDGNSATGTGSRAFSIDFPVCSQSGQSCTSNANCCSGLTCQNRICTPPPQICGNRIKEGTEQCDNGAQNGACPQTCSTTCTTNTCPVVPANSPPNCLVTSPAPGSTQTTNFAATINWQDPTTDSNALSRCEYQVLSNSIVTKPWTAVSGCAGVNSRIFSPTITVGPTANCKNNGPNTCTVACRATDQANAIGTRSSTYSISFQVCGNEIIEGTEQCDDANQNNNDACKNDCTNNICGDNFIRAGVEQCDNGVSNSNTCPATCSTTCTTNNCPVCLDDCSQQGLSQCTTDTQTQTCGNFDPDPCLEWSSPQTCTLGQVCENSICGGSSATQTLLTAKLPDQTILQNNQRTSSLDIIFDYQGEFTGIPPQGSSFSILDFLRRIFSSPQTQEFQYSFCLDQQCNRPNPFTTWSTQNQKTYQNLPLGIHTFKVKARYGDRINSFIEDQTPAEFTWTISDQTLCNLQIVDIAPDCLQGNFRDCEIGESLNFNAQFSGPSCTGNLIINLDLISTRSNCRININQLCTTSPCQFTYPFVQPLCDKQYKTFDQVAAQITAFDGTAQADQLNLQPFAFATPETQDDNFNQPGGTNNCIDGLENDGDGIPDSSDADCCKEQSSITIFNEDLSPFQLEYECSDQTRKRAGELPPTAPPTAQQIMQSTLPNTKIIQGDECGIQILKDQPQPQQNTPPQPQRQTTPNAITGLIIGQQIPPDIQNPPQPKPIGFYSSFCPTQTDDATATCTFCNPQNSIHYYVLDLPEQTRSFSLNPLFSPQNQFKLVLLSPQNQRHEFPLTAQPIIISKQTIPDHPTRFLGGRWRIGFEGVKVTTIQDLGASP